MNNLKNMSDYEKIIFVNGIDESSNEVNMTELSNKYPFVVFFTNNSVAKDTLGYDVSNIWKDSVRLTRFVGIDPENEIQIGDHTIKLMFDYSTGYLSLCDPNQLEAISFVSISYIDILGNTQNIHTLPATINAKDNKFKLYIKFKSVVDGDATKISESLRVLDSNNIIANDFTLLAKRKGTLSDNTNKTELTNEYDYQIIKDTYKDNTTEKTYVFASEYSINVKTDPGIPLNLILNPTAYNVYDENGNLLRNTITSFNNSENIKLNIKFNENVTSYDKRKLYLKITSSNANIKIDGGDSNESYKLYEIINGEVTAFLTTGTANNNTLLTFEVYYELNSSGLIRYNYLTQTKNVLLNGTEDAFWYAGYDNPMDETFDYEHNLKSFNSNNAGIEILYDWNEPTKSLGLANVQSPFYIAIPRSYENVIMPRWDGYILNDNGVKIYGDYRHAFTTSTRIINNITFVIYKSLFNGKLYGKIQ